MDQEACAQLVDEMATRPPWRDSPKARAALILAARAIRRGRLLTEQEKAFNLLRAIFAEDE